MNLVNKTKVSTLFDKRREEKKKKIDLSAMTTRRKQLFFPTEKTSRLFIEQCKFKQNLVSIEAKRARLMALFNCFASQIDDVEDNLNIEQSEREKSTPGCQLACDESPTNCSFMYLFILIKVNNNSKAFFFMLTADRYPV